MDVDEGAQDAGGGRSDPESEEGVPSVQVSVSYHLHIYLLIYHHCKAISTPTNEIQSAGIITIRRSPAPSVQDVHSSSHSRHSTRELSVGSSTAGPPSSDANFDNGVPIYLPPIHVRKLCNIIVSYIII